MNPRRRQQFLKVMDGDQRVMPVLFMLNQHRRCGDMLDWLIDNNVTGINFYNWFKFDNEGSLLYAMQDIVRRLEKEVEHRPMEIGRDLI